MDCGRIDLPQSTLSAFGFLYLLLLIASNSSCVRPKNRRSKPTPASVDFLDLFADDAQV